MQLKPDAQSVCAVHTSPSVPSTGSGCFVGDFTGAGGLAGAIGRAIGGADLAGAVGVVGRAGGWVPGAGYVAAGGGYVGGCAG